MRRKRLTEIGRADLEALIQQGAQEDVTLEFKATLPGRDGNPDPWIASQTKIGNPAKRDIAKELIAFANTAGGTLILGMQEDGERRAAELVNLPSCRELADRLSASIAASVDPPLTALEAVGVELDGTSGVVIFRVPMSHRAPHRDRDERECYHRSGDRSEPMQMRQIQDLAITTSRSADATRATLDKSSANFTVSRPSGQWMFVEGVGQIPLVVCGIRAAAVPLQPIYIEGITQRREYGLCLPAIQKLVSDSSQHQPFSPTDHPRWGPMLRGIRSREVPDDYEEFYQTIRADGLVEISLKAKQQARSGLGANGVALSVRRVYHVFAHLLIRVETLRTLLGNAELEFALDFEWIFPDGARIAFPGADGYSGLSITAPIEARNRITDYEMTSRSQLGILWEQIENDLVHSFGLSHVPRIRFDFDAAIRECMARSTGALS